MILQAETILSLLERRIKRRTKRFPHQYPVRSMPGTIIAQAHTHNPPEADFEACSKISDDEGSPAGDESSSAEIGVVTAC